MSHTFRLVQAAIPELQMTHAEHVPSLVARLVNDIGKEHLPQRRQCCNPRVVKRKMSDFPLKRLEHFQPPQPRGPFREAVLLI